MTSEFILALFNLFILTNGARILGIVPTPSFSHQVVFQPLWKELSLRGHNVTVVTTNPINDPNLTNLTEIDMHFSYDLINKNIIKIIDSSGNVFKTMIHFTNLAAALQEEQMEHPLIQKLLKESKQTFDLILMEHISIHYLGFGKHFNCPVIGIASLPIVEETNKAIGVPTHPVLYPDIMLPFDKAETFFQRVISLSFTVFMRMYMLYYVDPYYTAVIEKHFGMGFGGPLDLMSNVSLFLVNSNPILDHPRPLVPGVIHIGGIHRVPAKPLPKALKSTLDSATNGFIYFSLGSNVKSKDISLKTRQVLLDTFSELPYTVLWKFELDNLPNKSDNIIISKWFPQTDILKHPNIILFITQGGLQSIEEAVYEGIPMIGIPFFADQPGNVQKMVRKGFGLSIDFTSIEKVSFKKTISEVITNPKYRNKVKEISQLALDQPTSALERAVWWVEYVIRHKGAAHFRSPLLDIPWYQYWLLDVIACLVIIISVCLAFFAVVFKYVVKLCRKLLGLKQKPKVD